MPAGDRGLGGEFGYPRLRVVLPRKGTDVQVVKVAQPAAWQLRRRAQEPAPTT